MARRSRSKSLKNHPGNNLNNSGRTLAALWQLCAGSGCKLWIWLCEYLIRRLRRQNNNTQSKININSRHRKTLCRACEKWRAPSPFSALSIIRACPQTKTAIYCKITWLKKDPAEGVRWRGLEANRIHFGHAPFRAKFMARGSGWNYKRAFAEALMRSQRRQQPGRARTPCGRLQIAMRWNCSKCGTSLT